MLPLGTVVPVVMANFNSLTNAVMLIPVQALPANELFLVVVHGSLPGAVSDLAGNLLNSVYGVKTGSDYLLTVARGTDIVYPNENGDPVTLSLTGPGTIDIDRYVAGDLQVLQVVGGVANQTVVTGTISPTTPRSKIGSILGLGQFGAIPLKMTTPVFYLDGVTAFPNLASQVDAPAIDTLTPSPPVTTTSKSKTKKVKVKTPKPAHASAAHAAKVQTSKAPKGPASHHR